MGSHMDWNWHLWTRAEGDACRSNEGLGSCIHNSTCIGVSYPNEPLCPNDPPEIQKCEVPQGKGYCRSKENNGCPDGKFFPGTGDPWPCVGPNDIQCCVKSADMTTPTSTDTTSPTTTTDDTTTATTTPSSDEDSGLAGGQIAGIVVGVVAAVILVIAGAIWIYIRRRRARGRTPGVIEAAGHEKVELPSQETKAEVELPDTGPASGIPQSYGADDKKEIRGSELSPVELPSAANPPPQVQRPPVELDASESPAEPRKTE